LAEVLPAVHERKWSISQDGTKVGEVEADDEAEAKRKAKDLVMVDTRKPVEAEPK
jgi:hypothetical protein